MSRAAIPPDEMGINAVTAAANRRPRLLTLLALFATIVGFDRTRWAGLRVVLRCWRKLERPVAAIRASP